MSRSSRSADRSRSKSGTRVSLWRASNWRELWNALSDSLREHPIFDLEEAHGVSGATSAPGVVEASALTEAAREPLFREQWLRIFIVRLRLAATIGIVCLASFVGFYFVLYSGLAREILLDGAVAIFGMAAQIVLTFRVRSLAQARLLTLSGFALFSTTTAIALPLVFAPIASPQFAGARAVQFVIASSFCHILLTSLVLPLRLRETMFISGIVLSALVLGLNAIPTSMQTISMAGAVWIVGTVALFIVLLSQFNALLRRRVFDSAFDLALQALRMKAISETDSLTGGYNRRHCERVLETELARAARFGRPLSLLMFDLDNFKPVNDTLGHASGDRVLIAVHESAGAELREVDDLARIGGDEFLIILPETDQAQTQIIAHRLHERVLRELKIRFGSGSLLGKVTISVGALTLEPSHTLTANNALHRVDELLYEAKHEGKNRVISASDSG